MVDLEIERGRRRVRGGSLRFLLPLPPSVNHQYERRPGGVRLTRRARLYKEQVAWQVRLSRGDGVPDRVGLGLVAWLYFGKGGGDVDNRTKLLLDSVALGLGIDDRRFYSVYLEKRRDVESPRVEVVVWWHGED